MHNVRSPFVFACKFSELLLFRLVTGKYYETDRNMKMSKVGCILTDALSAGYLGKGIRWLE